MGDDTRLTLSSASGVQLYLLRESLSFLAAARSYKRQRSSLLWGCSVGRVHGTPPRETRRLGSGRPSGVTGVGGAHAEGWRRLYLVVLLYNERTFLREHLQQREEETQLLFHGKIPQRSRSHIRPSPTLVHPYTPSYTLAHPHTPSQTLIDPHTPLHTPS